MSQSSKNIEHFITDRIKYLFRPLKDESVSGSLIPVDMPRYIVSPW